jgi:hypothetical protein
MKIIDTISELENQLQGYTWQVENYFSYNKSFADVHNLSFVA